MTITFSSLTLFFIIGLASGFFNVAIKTAVPIVDNPLIISSLLPLVIVNLSEVNISVWPFSLIKIYLSSSNGKNVSLSSKSEGKIVTLPPLTSETISVSNLLR